LAAWDQPYYLSSTGSQGWLAGWLPAWRPTSMSHLKNVEARIMQCKWGGVCGRSASLLFIGKEFPTDPRSWGKRTP
uniref:Uncharacterized protein n=1 Tax=Varanus komodoensis TaxID=61221 RepID=A0A8D2IZK7_VARKO